MNTCRYCDQPAKRIQCGSVECKRAFHRDRMREYARQKSGFYNPKPTAECERCGAEFEAHAAYGNVKRFCSRRCQKRNASTSSKASALAQRAARGTVGNVVFIGRTDGPPDSVPKSEFYSQPGALTAAYRAGDAAKVAAVLLSRTTPDAGCLLWTGRVDRDGYPKVRAGGRNVAPHRLVAQGTHGNLNGEPVHHTCANRACLNPIHLQPVSQRENVAEMIERNWYKQRIEALEQALAMLDAQHPLISHPAA